ETDARAITVTRTVDPADRVTFVDYADDDLDVTYTWDSCTFGQGRLCGIEAGSTTIDYAYDRFGRRTQDGTLSYSYDANGNRTVIEFDTGISVVTDSDFADRPATLDLYQDTNPTPVVTGASYLPSGPLSSLTLGNGVTETRNFDARYFPA